MEAENAEGKLPYQGAQHGFQPGFADALGGGHDLPLRDLIHRVDVVDAFAGGRIALVHGIHPQVAGPDLADRDSAARRWSPPWAASGCRRDGVPDSEAVAASYKL